MSDIQQRGFNETQGTESGAPAPAVKPATKRSWWKWAVAALAAAVLAFVGIRAVSATPQARILSAIDFLVSAESSDLALSVALTPEALTALGVSDAQVRSLGVDGIASVAEAATALEAMRMRFLTQRGEGIEDGKSFIRLEYVGRSVLMFGLAERALYLQLDLDALSEGQPPLQSPAQVARLKSDLLSAVSWLAAGDDFVAGEPVMLSFAKSSPLGDLWDEQLGSGSQGGGADAQLEEFQSAVLEALRSTSTISDDGQAEGLDRILVRIDAAEFTLALLKALPSSLRNSLGVDLKQSEQEVKQQLAGKSYDFRFLFDGSDLKRIEFDLSALADPGQGLAPESAVLRIEFGDEVAEAPAGAIDVTDELAPLVSMLTGAAA